MMRIVKPLLFIVAAVLVALAGCSFTPAATPVPSATALDPTPVDTSTPITRVTPKPNVTSSPFIFSQSVEPTPVCPDAPRTRLIVQERGRVMDNDPRALRMRNGPGTAYEIVAQIPINNVFFVLDGPICGESYTWYQVRYKETDGWIAEGDGEQYYVEPYLPG